MCEKMNTFSRRDAGIFLVIVAIIARMSRINKCCLFSSFLAVWILLLLINSSSRNQTEDSFSSRTETSLETRRNRHARGLYIEIALLTKKKVKPWQDFLRDSIRPLMEKAPCFCGPCGNVTVKLCPQPLTKLKGDLSDEVNATFRRRVRTPMELYPREGLELGGAWKPSDCQAREKVAIIIPFRDRWLQLKTLLGVLHPMLQRQGACYRIFVVEQYGGGAFNKGRLNNAGFLEAAKRFRFDCVIYQDTDIIPLNDHNLYRCPGNRPRHMAVAVDVHKFRLPYSALVGGVIAFTVPQYVRLNGYSNFYWGWGLEDDDMEIRMKSATRIRYSRPSAKIARYKALSHRPQRIYALQGARRKPLLSTITRRYRFDGLSSVKYVVMAERNETAYTHLILFIGEQPEDFNDE